MSSYCVGQIKLDSVSQAQINERIKQKADLVAEYFSFIGDRGTDLQTRLLYAKKCLSLFVGKGDSIVIDGTKRNGVLIEISSLQGRTSKRLLKSYLNGLANQRYNKVKILSIDVAKIDYNSLKKVSDNTYVCKAYFEKVYVDNRDKMSSHEDLTKRAVNITLEVNEVDGEGIEYHVPSVFGDIVAIEDSTK